VNIKSVTGTKAQAKLLLLFAVFLLRHLSKQRGLASNGLAGRVPVSTNVSKTRAAPLTHSLHRPVLSLSCVCMFALLSHQQHYTHKRSAWQRNTRLDGSTQFAVMQNEWLF
jgi:hypothetical protein